MKSVHCNKRDHEAEAVVSRGRGHCRRGRGRGRCQVFGP